MFRGSVGHRLGSVGHRLGFRGSSLGVSRVIVGGSVGHR